jgi:hypothetical protein
MNPRTRRNRRLHRQRATAESIVGGPYQKALALYPFGGKRSERESAHRKVLAVLKPFLTHKSGRVRDCAAAEAAALGTETT